MLFWNTDYSQGLAGHMRPVSTAVRPASAECCWLCHLSSDGLVESGFWTQSGTVHRKYTVLPRRIDRNEYYFALLCIVRQVTIPYLPCSFGGTPRCFDGLKSRVRTQGSMSCMPADPGCSQDCKHSAPLWFTENIRLPRWILSIAISIIDLNAYRWFTAKIMYSQQPWKPIGRQRWSH